MTAIRLSRLAEADINRLTDFLRQDQPAAWWLLPPAALGRPWPAEAAAETFELIAGAIDLLAAHPLIGRRVERGLRELVISRGRSGYLALYDFDAAADVAHVLAIRHQRETGYRDPQDAGQ